MHCDFYAVLISVFLFVVPYEIFVVLTALLLQSDSHSVLQTLFVYAALPLAFVLIAVGYLAARLAGVAGVANGAAVGLVISAALLFGPYMTLDIHMGFGEFITEFGPHALVMGIFWCSLGGLIREITAY